MVIGHQVVHGLCAGCCACKAERETIEKRAAFCLRREPSVLSNEVAEDLISCVDTSGRDWHVNALLSQTLLNGCSTFMRWKVATSS